MYPYLQVLTFGSRILTALGGQDIPVYPLAAPVEATYPFIAYRRSSAQIGRCKDGTSKADIIIDVVVVSDKYGESVDLAAKAINSLQELNLDMCVIDAAEDVLADGANSIFTQTLILKFTIEE